MAAPATPPSKQAPATQTPDLGGAEHGAAAGQGGGEDQSGVQFQTPPDYTDPMDDLDQIAGKPPKRKRDDRGRFKQQRQQSDDGQQSDDDDQQSGTDQGTGAADEGDGSGGEGGAAGADQGDADQSQQAGRKGAEGQTDDQDGFLESAAYKRSKPLREAYDRLRESHTALERERDKLKTQLEQGDFNTALADENNNLKGRIKQYQAQQIVKDYKESDEYKSKFIEPMTQLIDMAVAEIEGVEVDLGDGHVRPARKQDFLDMIEMPLKQAAKAAHAMFGDAAPHILSMRQQIRTINAQRKQAVEMAEKNSEEVAKRQLAERAEQQRHNQQVWVTADQKIVARFPDLFGEVEGDTQHNELLSKGLQEVDLAISSDSPLKPEQRITQMAAIRRKAASFNAMVRKLRSYEDRIEELEAELAERDSGDPDAGGGGGGGEGGKSDKFVSADDDPEAPWNKK